MKQVELVANGHKLVCSFGLGFLGECLENLDLSVYEIGEKLDKNSFKYVPILMYESVKYKKEVDFSLDDLIEWLDDDGKKGLETMNKFVMAFLQSITKDVPKADEKAEATPKKK